MMYPIISREKFCEYINLLKKMDEKEDSLTQAFRNLDENADVAMVGLYTPERRAILDLLNQIMDVPTTKEWGGDIDYFCYELNFGKDYKDGSVTDSDGTIINMGTPEDLYDYLVKDYFERHPEEVKK